jgi:nucleotide-binding universal stress UspA family protein
MPSVLCPVDFSDPSRSALRYASAIADHFGARLTILTVADPLLAEVSRETGRVPGLEEETTQELERFCADILSRDTAPKTVEYLVAVGKPATEILRVANELATDLIVISSHGRSGLRHLFFGSTTERVLRETSVPVLVTPDAGRPAASLSEIARHINRIVVPVDLTAASSRQVTIAAGIAEAISVPLILTHVLEPVFVPYGVRLAIPGAEAARRELADERLTAVAASVKAGVSTESLVLVGEPSEEVARLADVRGANLIVIGLHSSGLLGPRMGSVTYRVLCLTHALVLAIPPEPAAARERTARTASTHAVA